MESIKKFLQRKNTSFPRSATASTHWGPWHRAFSAPCTSAPSSIPSAAKFHIDFLTAQIAEKVPYTVGGLTSFMSGPAMAIAIGYALQAPPLVLFSLAAVGYACNLLGGAAARWQCCLSPSSPPNAVRLSARKPRLTFWSRPLSPPSSGVGAAYLIAPPIGAAASAFGQVIMQATALQPFLMGILVSVLVGIALTLPISSAAICSVLGSLAWRAVRLLLAAAPRWLASLS